MKKYIILFLFGLGFMMSPSLFAQVGMGTNQPDKSAVLELKSGQRGLLIPRFDIPDLQDAAPVTTPANALLVYNTGDTNPDEAGFYYWNSKANGGSGAWILIKSAGNDFTTKVDTLKGGNLNLVIDTTGQVVTFNLGVKPGAKDGLVLTTQIVGTDTSAVWISPSALFGKFFQAKNGLHMRNDSTVVLGGKLDSVTTIDANGYPLILKNLSLAKNPDSVLVKSGDTLRVISVDSLVTKGMTVLNGLTKSHDTIRLGGTLTKPTVITTDATNTLAIAGLQKKSSDSVVSVDANGVLHYMALDSIQRSVKNGLRIDGDTIKLGGVLTEPTTIDVTSDSLMVKGLTAATSANKMVVAQGTSGALHTVERTVSGAVTATTTIDDTWNANYSPYVLQVNITVDVANLSAGDIDLTLPDATKAEGQVISIKTIDPTNKGDQIYYLNIKEGGSTIAYGALPYQSWIVKSNGTNWVIMSSH